jgi:putative FmdB family regulatory protein
VYDYKCLSCDEIFEKNVKIAQMNEMQECPYCGESHSEKFIGGAPALGDPVRLGLKKPPDVFRDRLREIHKTSPGSILSNNSSYI